MKLRCAGDEGFAEEHDIKSGLPDVTPDENTAIVYETPADDYDFTYKMVVRNNVYWYGEYIDELDFVHGTHDERHDGITVAVYRNDKGMICIDPNYNYGHVDEDEPPYETENDIPHFIHRVYIRGESTYMVTALGGKFLKMVEDNEVSIGYMTYSYSDGILSVRHSEFKDWKLEVTANEFTLPGVIIEAAYPHDRVTFVDNY